jgi:predicted DNA-binding transcriptional regulator AlpA
MTTGMLADDEGLLTKQDAADLVEMSLSMLRRRHRKGTGPPCREISRLVRYRKAAVQRWVTGSLQAGSPNQNRWQRVFSEALC